MADYWIKLYHEILDDPKMATLPDNLYRRAIEVFLLAGRFSQERNGNIPDTAKLAWALRMNETQLQSDLEALEKVGIVKQRKDGWFVLNFEKRQQALSSTERSQRHRERQRKQQYYDNATQMQRNVAENKKENKNIELEQDTEAVAGGVFEFYEQNIGALTSYISDDLGNLIDDYGEAWVMDAMKEAVKNEKRKLSYFTAILKNWKSDGRSKKSKPTNGSKPFDHESNPYRNAKVYE